MADLGEPLPITPPVDAILSTATFHWVPDHAALFRHLAAVLRPGGRLVAQCGGVGNVASILAVLATVGDGWLGPAHFETPEATRDRLAAAGFVDIETWLNTELTSLEPGEPFETFLATVVLGPHLERLPEADRAGVRPRGREPAAPARDRLRPAEHRGDPSRLSGAAPVRPTRPRTSGIGERRLSACACPSGPRRGPPGTATDGRAPRGAPCPFRDRGRRPSPGGPRGHGPVA